MTSSQVPEPIDERNLPRSYDDVRQWLELVESMGELKRIDGADWDLEIGALTEVAGRGRGASAILFDHIKDYPAGRRVLVGMIESLKRVAGRLKVRVREVEKLDVREVLSLIKEYNRAAKKAGAKEIADPGRLVR